MQSKKEFFPTLTVLQIFRQVRSDLVSACASCHNFYLSAGNYVIKLKMSHIFRCPPQFPDYLFPPFNLVYDMGDVVVLFHSIIIYLVLRLYLPLF